MSRTEILIAWLTLFPQMPQLVYETALTNVAWL